MLKQLQGFEIPANAWENQVLSKRMRLYNPDVLDKLCLTGQIGWGRLSPHPATLNTVPIGLPDGHRKEVTRRVIPTSVAPITFFVREEIDWLVPKHVGQDLQTRGLSQAAQDLSRILSQRGACFFADIVRASGLLKSEVESALWELVTAGVVTADGFDNLRALIDPRRRAGQGRGRTSRPRHSTGRWSLLYTGCETDRSLSIEATCRLLLKRYGIVFRDLLVRETIVPRWRELLYAFRRLEDRGEIRGGRFVSGFLGEQFALPVAVEGLRSMRNKEPTGELLTVSAADPLNLVGIILPGDRITAVSGKYITYRDGCFLQLSESPRPSISTVARS